MNFVSKMMNSVSKTMNSVSKMMNPVLKMNRVQSSGDAEAVVAELEKEIKEMEAVLGADGSERLAMYSQIIEAADLVGCEDT